MTTETTEITTEERDNILKGQEGYFFDVKSIDIHPAKLTESLSAFANAAGGDLYIGIDEKQKVKGKRVREWRGFDNQEAANGHIQAIEEFFSIGPVL